MTDKAWGPDPDWLAGLKREWLALIEVAVWGDLKSPKIGALSKFRKRVLDLGERLKSLSADRDWIPRERERLKNLLGSCLNLRDTLLLAERAAQDIDGGEDLDRLTRHMIALHRAITSDLRDHENAWARALETLNKDALDDDAD